MAQQREPERLVLFGGFNVERGPSGAWCTTAQFRDFLDSLSERFSNVTFVTWSHAAPVGYRSEIASPKIQVVAMRPGVRHRAALLTKIVTLSRGAHLWVHLPNGVCLFPVLPIIWRTTRSITVYLANDYLDFLRFSRYAGVWGGRSYFNSAHRQWMRRADQVIARGKKLSRQASAYNKRVFETIPITNLPLVDDERDLPEPSRRSVTYIGQMLWGKGLRELITAFERLRSEGLVEHAPLHLVGGGADLEPIREFAKEKLGEDGARFFGWVDSPEEMDSAWRHARLLVVPSSAYGEGVPRAIDEGLARRVPVVATRIGGIAEEYQDGEALLVDPGDVEGLRTAIRQVLTDPALVTRMQDSAERRLTRWREFSDAGHQHASIILGAAAEPSKAVPPAEAESA